jgi:uncharacterized membrane protein YoaK (UPF0700 family)
MSQQVPARKLPKHLIDPANPPHRQPPEERKRDLEKLAKVKEWVSSVLVVTTMFHLSVGLAIAAILMDSSRTQARVGLNVIAILLLLSGAIGARMIHHKKPISPWLLLSFVPGAVAFYLTFR